MLQALLSMLLNTGQAILEHDPLISMISDQLFDNTSKTYSVWASIFFRSSGYRFGPVGVEKIHLAAITGQVVLLKFLFYGGEPNRNILGRFVNNIQTLSLANVRDIPYKRTALWWACRFGHLEVVDFLIERGSKVLEN